MTGVSTPGGADPPAHLESVERRHHHVEQHEVGIELVDPIERRAPVAAHVDDEAGEPQRAREEMTDVLVVVDDEYALTAVGGDRSRQDAGTVQHAVLVSCSRCVS